MVFPYDFGYVPATKAEDGDPLDVLVLTDEPLFPGCSVDCRLIGAIEMEQQQEGEKFRNDRLIAVATQSLLYSETHEIHEIHEVNPVVLKQIKDFFVNYQRVRGVELRFWDIRDCSRRRNSPICRRTQARSLAVSSSMSPRAQCHSFEMSRKRQIVNIMKDSVQDGQHRR